MKVMSVASQSMSLAPGNAVEYIESRDTEDEENANNLLSEIRDSELLMNDRRRDASTKLHTSTTIFELNIQRAEKQALLEKLEIELERITQELHEENEAERCEVRVISYGDKILFFKYAHYT